MPTNVLTEKDYQKYIINKLINDNGYILRKDNDFDRLFAIDREMLFDFLNNTQPEAMESLTKIYKDDLEDTIVNFINNEATKKRGSILEVLKHGIEISNQKLRFMYTKPATTFNKKLLEIMKRIYFQLRKKYGLQMMKE